MRSIFATLLYVLCAWVVLPSTKAQAGPTVSADSSVGTAITIETAQEQFTVNGGTTQGTGLFHSFDDFSPESWAVLFDLNNSAYNNIDMIVSRVTGQQASLINGKLEIQGGNSPDLFLINPAGILFGAQATLQLPGSFLASTAESIHFGNEQFSATDTTNLSGMLSINTPIGLQLNLRSASISQVGSGHALASTNPNQPIFSPYAQTQLHGGLRVNAGQSLALIGNGVTLTGGILTAPDGQINVVSDNQGTIGLSLGASSGLPGFSLVPNSVEASEPISPPGDITLDQRSLIDISGTNGMTGSTASLVGHNIAINNGSLVWSQNRGATPAGSLAVEGTGNLDISGQLTSGLVTGGILAEVINSGDSASVRISASDILVTEGNLLGSKIFAQGNGAAVTIDANRLTVSGHAAIAPNLFTQAGSITLSAGNTSNVSVTAEQSLEVTEGGFLGATTLFADGAGGNVKIDAGDIVVAGATPTGEISLIAATSIAGSGNAGNLAIQTDSLSVLDSGGIITSSFTDGSAGNVSITATDWIRVGGQLPNNRTSTISSGVVLAPAVYQQILGASQIPTGNAGDVNIVTNRLSIDEGGSLTVANLGTGQAGTLEVQADDILLNGGDVSAVTASGRGGNIALQANTLQTKGGGLIQATSLGAGDGGNIDINSRFIISQENSDIVANAIDGRGGNIAITTRGIFGLQFRDRLTDQSDITASSDIGVDGTVAIENTGLDSNTELAVLPTYFSDVDNNIVSSCSDTQGNQFVASGRGGLATNPSDQLDITHLWQDVREVTGPTQRAASLVSQDNLEHRNNSHTATNVLYEATSWQRNPAGEIELHTGNLYPQSIVSCLPTTANLPQE